MHSHQLLHLQKGLIMVQGCLVAQNSKAVLIHLSPNKDTALNTNEPGVASWGYCFNANKTSGKHLACLVSLFPHVVNRFSTLSPGMAYEDK